MWRFVTHSSLSAPHRGRVAIVSEVGVGALVLKDVDFDDAFADVVAGTVDEQIFGISHEQL